MAGWIQQSEEDAKVDAEPMRVAEILDLYIDEHVEQKVHDKQRIATADIPVRKFFGEMRSDKIDDGTIAAYCRARSGGQIGRVVGAGTIRRELEHLSAALGYASRNSGRTRLTKAAKPIITKPTKPPSRSRVATDEELDRLMTEAALVNDGGLFNRRKAVKSERLTRIYRFIALARWTAARKEAIETLTWNRIDFDAGLIDFRDPLRVETKKRRVPVPIDPRLLPILQRAFAERTGLYVLDHPNKIRPAWDKAAERAGLTDVTPHVLRHTWATQAVARGVSMWKVAMFLGDTVETVERTYAHRSPEYLRDVFDGAQNGAFAPDSGASHDGQRRTMLDNEQLKSTG